MIKDTAFWTKDRKRCIFTAIYEKRDLPGSGSGTFDFNRTTILPAGLGADRRRI
jgi:hypothetical protein